MEKQTKINLEDSYNKINENFNKLEKYLNNNNEYNSQIDLLLNQIKNRIDLMDNDKNDLNEYDKNIWKKKIKEINSKYENYLKKCEELKKDKGDGIIDPSDIEESIDHNKLSIEEEYKRGTKILDKDEKILGELIDIVQKDNQTLMVVRENLDNQAGEIDKIDPNLKEIEFSLKRAGLKIREIGIYFAQDKLKKFLIIFIVLMILIIIIVSACGGKEKNNFNLPFDIFSNNNKGNNTDTDNGINNKI